MFPLSSIPMKHALLCVLLWAGLSAGSIFHQHLSKEVLLDLFDVAERELKVFIYPIPEHVERYTPEGDPSAWQQCIGRTFEIHFCIEEIFIRYLQDVKNNFEDYPHLKTNFMVRNADEANAFIIDHTWVMKNSVEKHLRPIINNVVDNYPYYNRSYGHDHFLIYPYDFGVLCSGRHMREDWSEIDNCQVDEQVGHKYFCHVARILNTSFIGNYGMDTKYYIDNGHTFGLQKCIGVCPKVICHRPDIDIVTPQYLKAKTHACYTDLENNRSLYVRRDFDSCFKGNYRHQRFILKEMKTNDLYHYKYNKTERFQETDDLQKCIFAYHMCGEACWSQRLYDALALGAIPVIAIDGSIQAFERYVDWRTISIKISVAELFQDRFTFRFRRGLRRQADLFRKHIKQAHNASKDGFISYPYNQQQSTDTNTIKLTSSSHFSSVASVKKKLTKAKKKPNDFGFVLTKMVNVRASVEWFNFRDLKREVNAFRMLVLEMFCRLVRQRTPPYAPEAEANGARDLLQTFSKINSSTLVLDKSFQYYVCSRRSDFTARLRYVR